MRILPGGQAIVSRAMPKTGTFDIWQVDLADGRQTRLTSEDRATEYSAVQLSDGKTMLLTLSRGLPPRVARWEIGSATPPMILLRGSTLQQITDLSRNGRLIAYNEATPTQGFDIFTMAVDDPTAVVARESTAHQERDLRFSTDSRYYSFLSDTIRLNGLYISPLDGGPKKLGSQSGALRARWNPVGGELLYLGADFRMVSVQVSTSPTLSVLASTTLFTTSARGWKDFAVSLDGKRFLALILESAGDEQPLTAVLNWRR